MSANSLNLVTSAVGGTSNGFAILELFVASNARCRFNFTRRDARNFEANLNTTPIKKPEPAKKPDFEKSLGRLEEVVRRLESPQLSLDDAMKLFEEGVELSRECQKQLEEAEGKVEILLKKADGKLTAQPFDPERESEL
jgi:exodeoxyribonuclease VII small subunit